MSEIRTDTINNASGDNDSGIDLSTNDQVSIKTANTTALTVDASQNVIVSSNEPTLFLKDSNNTNTTRYIKNNAEIFTIGRINDDLSASSVEHLRVDDSGNLLVGTTESNPTSSAVNVAGQSFSATNGIRSTVDQNPSATFNRKTNDGSIVLFRKDGTTVGSIGNDSNNLYIVFSIDNDVGLAGGGGVSDKIFPTGNNGLVRDDGVDLGYVTGRFDNIYATNGTIQTSDQNEKNTITDSDLGIDFIKRLTPKSYIFNGKTRTHYGLIAQDVETVLTDINKPTSGFAGFIKSDISEEQDGSEYRYGLRYTEFVAPLIQAVKDQQAIIEDLQARITALENS